MISLIYYVFFLIIFPKATRLQVSKVHFASSKPKLNFIVSSLTLLLHLASLPGDMRLSTGGILMLLTPTDHLKEMDSLMSRNIYFNIFRSFPILLLILTCTKPRTLTTQHFAPLWPLVMAYIKQILLSPMDFISLVTPPDLKRSSRPLSSKG